MFILQLVSISISHTIFVTNKVLEDIIVKKQDLIWKRFHPCVTETTSMRSNAFNVSTFPRILWSNYPWCPMFNYLLLKSGTRITRISNKQVCSFCFMMYCAINARSILTGNPAPMIFILVVHKTPVVAFIYPQWMIVFDILTQKMLYKKDYGHNRENSNWLA